MWSAGMNCSGGALNRLWMDCANCPASVFHKEVGLAVWLLCRYGGYARLIRRFFSTECGSAMWAQRKETLNRIWATCSRLMLDGSKSCVAAGRLSTVRTRLVV